MRCSELEELTLTDAQQTDGRGRTRSLSASRSSSEGGRAGTVAQCWRIGHQPRGMNAAERSVVQEYRHDAARRRGEALRSVLWYGLDGLTQARTHTAGFGQLILHPPLRHPSLHEHPAG
jgi:hypothetical protein